MFRAVLCLWLFLSLTAAAEDHALIKATDYWRVSLASAITTNTAPAWDQSDYDDSTWSSLQASFIGSRYGSPGFDEQTTLPIAGAATYCFRKSFVIDDPNFAQWLTLRIDYESGFVAYLNGFEIARRSFPDLNGQPVPLNARPLFHSRGYTEWIDVSAAAPLLRAGTNVLAIQLHNADETDSGILLVAELSANFTRGPYIQNTTTNSTQIIWQTQQPTTGFVTYGKDMDHLFIAPATAAATRHAVTLTGLEPNQSYIYRVFIESGESLAASEWVTFRTFKLPGARTTFVAAGDLGQVTTGQYEIAKQLNAIDADLFIPLGDLVYYCYTASSADARFFSIYREQMKRVPVFPCLGNHDSYCGGQPDFLYDFYLPTNSVTGTEQYYSFDNGDAHFVILALDAQAGMRYYPGSDQYRWLEADLAATRQKWKFLFFHHVIRSSSLHSVDTFLGEDEADKYIMRATIGALAERYGVQVIFNGHDHDYERFASINGVNSFVCGGGGASLYEQILDRDHEEPSSMQFYAKHSFARVTVDGPDLTVEAVDMEGNVFDRLYRSQTGGGPEPYASIWGTPKISGMPGSGLDGNTPRQVFSFSGPSIRSKAGVRANLGRVHVRNDRNFFYVGFEQSAIWTNQVIALFLENPAQPGVTDLAPLGDNQFDPDSNAAQGADGLDQLQNLGFQNFRPSIGCLLGDEIADGNFRTYRRPKTRWASGQGVFHLDAAFTTVPGVRIQQFNRNPQGAPVSKPESNADFIELAIPLAELGSPKFPDALRVGAVVFDIPESGALEPQIDTAFAGQSLTPAENGRVILEPITIQLAVDPDPSSDEFNFRATILSATQLRFDWDSIPGVNYRLQLTARLGDHFEDVVAPGLPLLATSSAASYTLAIDDSSPRFYRLREN